MQECKLGLTNIIVPLSGGMIYQKSSPGDNRVVAGESSHHFTLYSVFSDYPLALKLERVWSSSLPRVIGNLKPY